MSSYQTFFAGNLAALAGRAADRAAWQVSDTKQGPFAARNVALKMRRDVQAPGAEPFCYEFAVRNSYAGAFGPLIGQIDSGVRARHSSRQEFFSADDARLKA